MDDHESGIPLELYSEYEGRPFKCCTRCGETLSDSEEGYQVSKVYKNEECVLEFAICFHCHEKMVDEFSEESKANMQAFQDEHMEPRGLEQCAVCAADRVGIGVEMKEFNLGALCHDQELLQGVLICGECNDQMQELISTKTREQRDRFIAENFPCAPNDEVPEPSTPTNTPVLF